MQTSVVLTNADLSTHRTNDEWIRERTGISERGICHVETTDMAEVATRHALAAAGLETTDLDLIVIATVTRRSVVQVMHVCCKSVSVRSMRVLRSQCCVFWVCLWFRHRNIAGDLWGGAAESFLSE